jgi:hypothetical protein
LGYRRHRRRSHHQSQDGAGDAVPATFEAKEITHRLSALVESGTSDDWKVRNGVLDVEVSDEGLLYDLIDHVWDGMVQNAEYNSESGLMSDWNDADHAIETYTDIEFMEYVQPEDGLTPLEQKMLDFAKLLDEDHVKEIAAEVIERRMAEYDARVKSVAEEDAA